MLFKQKARFSVNHTLQTEKKPTLLFNSQYLEFLPRDFKILPLILIGKSPFQDAKHL